MSGVVGIIDTKDVGLRLYYSLMAIQHRGQDAGYFNKQRFRILFEER